MWGGRGEVEVVVKECKVLVDEVVIIVGVVGVVECRRIVVCGVVVHVSAVVREAVRKLTAVTSSNYS